MLFLDKTKDFSSLELLNEFRLNISKEFYHKKLFTSVGVGWYNARQKLYLDDPAFLYYFNKPSLAFSNIMAHVLLGYNIRLSHKVTVTPFLTCGFNVWSSGKKNYESYSLAKHQDQGIDSVHILSTGWTNSNFMSIGLGNRLTYYINPSVSFFSEIELRHGMNDLFTSGNVFYSYDEGDYVHSSLSSTLDRGSRFRMSLGIKYYL